MQSLADWEKDRHENRQRNVQPKLLPVNFRLPMVPAAALDVNQYSQVAHNLKLPAIKAN